MTITRKPLIAGVLRKTVGGTAHAERQPRGFSHGERAQVREAVADPRDTKERTIDHVVEKLLKELTW